MSVETIDNKKLIQDIKILDRVLNSIKLCTQPIDGHTDPNSIKDCWDEVSDTIASLKETIKFEDAEQKAQPPKRERRFGDFTLEETYVCMSCGLSHKQVECSGIYGCPNIACTISGNANFRTKLKSYRQDGSSHTVDVEEWIQEVEKNIPLIEDAAIKAATEYSLFKLKQSK